MTGIDAIRVMTLQLLGQAPPPPQGQPGRVIQARDEPFPSELLAQVTSPTELALLLGCSKQAAHQKLKKATWPGNPSYSVTRTGE